MFSRSFAAASNDCTASDLKCRACRGWSQRLPQHGAAGVRRVARIRSAAAGFAVVIVFVERNNDCRISR